MSKGRPMQWAAAAAVVTALTVMTASMMASSGSARYELEEERFITLPQGLELASSSDPNFKWNDDSTEQFMAACKGGDQSACDTISSSDEALAILNKHTRADSQPLYVTIDNAVQGAVPEQESQMAGEDWDEKVPLAYPIEKDDLYGNLNAGNVLVPASEVRPKLGAKSSSAPVAAPRRKQHKGIETVGLAMVPRAGLARQWGLEGLARQGLARKPMYSPTDPCRPNGPMCGPTRPAVDYGGDIVLTDGWLNEQTSDEKACCPCLGKGVKRINYDDYPGAGSYNPYVMEMCKVCAGCELVEDPGLAKQPSFDDSG
eukprot:CAMPEP_0173392498 /NCGR_PEP_ID=MMETSP1356-20130122/19877_1 /TAXON_ID=77927 ORGANISM="Hemiselmis virescens, Strain PCC157" /NCGR_SAMPLE_ID=MMETSP1356 /ASSEMBLY_ACC=CAM_ASM_000847 /LENGTH=314 /DNA_ID=CAMNT_0014350309 /DNA_START=6 /DNA_END=947 /DNA_ORIENTATION=+